MRAPLPLQSYPVRSTKQNAQRLINMYAVPDTAGGKTQVALYPTPGLLEFGDTNGFVIRGMLEVRGTLYLVKDDKFGTMSSSGVFVSVGTLSTATGRVSLAATFDEILIATGSTAYHYKISTTTFSTVSDADFPANCSYVAALDEYFIALKPSTDEFYLSTISDGLTWAALTFAAAETKSDNLVAALPLFQELWLFGETVTEIWFNTGAEFPFERQEGAFINYGCLSDASVVMANNTAFWLGKSSSGQRIILTAENQFPKIISTEAMHFQMESYASVSDAFAYAYQQLGHEFYVITFPTANKTWAYDITTNLWHERNSINTASGTPQPAYTRHRANAYAFAHNKHLVGDYRTGKVFELDLDTFYDDSTKVIQRQIITPALANQGKHLSIYSLELFAETGVGLLTGQGSDPQVMLEVSRDGGFTYGNARFMGIGALGQYKQRIKWNQLGTARDFVFRITVTDPIKWIVLGADIEIDVEAETPQPTNQGIQ